MISHLVRGNFAQLLLEQLLPPAGHLVKPGAELFSPGDAFAQLRREAAGNLNRFFDRVVDGPSRLRPPHVGAPG